VMNRQINLALTLLIAVVGLLHSAPLSAMPKAMLNPNPVAVGVFDTEIRMVLAPPAARAGPLLRTDHRSGIQRHVGAVPE
jgi:hypothetical protein